MATPDGFPDWFNDLSVRACNLIEAHKIRSVREFVCLTVWDLKCWRGMGHHTIQHIRELLRKNGVHLLGDADGSLSVKEADEVWWNIKPTKRGETVFGFDVMAILCDAHLKKMELHA